MLPIKISSHLSLSLYIYAGRSVNILPDIQNTHRLNYYFKSTCSFNKHIYIYIYIYIYVEHILWARSDLMNYSAWFFFLYFILFLLLLCSLILFLASMLFLQSRKEKLFGSNPRFAFLKDCAHHEWRSRKRETPSWLREDGDFADCCGSRGCWVCQ